MSGRWLAAGKPERDAGQEPEGWKFFDKEYQLSDKQELKKDIKQALQRDPIYRAIYIP